MWVLIKSYYFKNIIINRKNNSFYCLSIKFVKLSKQSGNPKMINSKVRMLLWIKNVRRPTERDLNFQSLIILILFL